MEEIIIGCQTQINTVKETHKNVTFLKKILHDKRKVTNSLFLFSLFLISDPSHPDFFGPQGYFDIFPPGHHHPHHPHAPHHNGQDPGSDMGPYMPPHPQIPPGTPMTSVEQPLPPHSMHGPMEGPQFLHPTKEMNGTNTDSMQPLSGSNGDLLTIGERYTSLPPRSVSNPVSMQNGGPPNGVIGGNGYRVPEVADGAW